MSRTYHVTITIPLEITIPVQAEDRDSLRQSVQVTEVRRAIAMAPFALTDEQLKEAVDCGWDDAGVEDVSQSQADDDAVSEHYDNAGADS